MANHTRAQRYNDRMDEIFSRAKELNAFHDKGRAKHASESHKGEYPSCKTCHVSESKKSSIANKMK